MSEFSPPDDLYDETAGCSTDELADLLRLVRGTRKEWADLEAIIEADLGLAAGVGQHETYIVRQSATKTEWEHDRVKDRLVALGRDAGSPSAMAAIIWDCVPKNPAWRVGGLKAHGIEASEYRQRIPGRRTVELLAVPEGGDDGDMSNGDER